MNFDEKKLLKSQNSRLINDFIISNREKLVVRHHSIWPGPIFSAETTLLQKQKETLSGSNHLGFIYETKLPPDHHLGSEEKPPESNSKFSAPYHLLSTEDTVPKSNSKSPAPRPNADSFYWQTTQKHIQDAIDYGIFEPGALTSKVIGAVGAYRLQVLERAYDNGIISNKFEQKEMLLRLTQTRIRSLECLERLTNTYDYGSSSDDNAHRIVDTFEDYIQSLYDLREQVKLNLSVLNEYDLVANQKIQAQITEDIFAAEAYRDELINAWGRSQLNQNTLENSILSACGSYSVAQFIKLRMIAALREAQEHNQNMTYSRAAMSFSRGQLNSFCEDALRAINEHQPDQHNPTLKEHQGYYGEEDESITINFQHLGKNRQRIRQTLMAITQIEGRDVIAKDHQGDYHIISKNESGQEFKHKLKTTHFTGWDVQDDRTYLPKRIFFWFWNFIVVGIVGGLIIDLLPNLWLGLRGDEPKSFVSRLRLGFTPVCVEGTQFINLADRINIPTVSLGAIVGRAIGNFFRNTIWEIRNGIKSTYKLAKLQVFDNLISDYQIGHNPLPDENTLYKIIEVELKIHHKQEKKFSQELESLHQKAGVKEFSKINPDEIVSRHAHPPYELNPGEWSDAINSALNGAKHIIESVTHEIHAKHPFAGLLFNFFYIAGGLAILAPQYVSFLGNYFLQISKAIADASSTQPFAGAVSAAFYEAYVTATLSEVLVSGRNSGLISALTSLEDQPSSFMIYGTLAVGLGWFLANVLDIPGISEGIREELGTVPAIAYGAAGAKFGIVLLELFMIEPGEPNSEHATKREKLKHFFKSEYPQFEDAKIDRLIDDLLEHTLAKNSRPEAKADMRRLEFLMMLQQNQHILPNLSNLRKRQLIEVMRKQERFEPNLVDAVQQMLFPENKKSILGITMNIIFGYVFALTRCLAAIVTWNAQPFRFLFAEKIPKDLARLYHAINNKILNTFFNYLRTMIRGICDIVANEIIARTEGFIRSKYHRVSRGTYTVTSSFDRAFTSAKEFLGRISGIDPLRKAVTKPHATSVFQRIYHKFRYGYHARNAHTSPLEVTSTAKSQPVKTVSLQNRVSANNQESAAQTKEFAPLLLDKNKRAAQLEEFNRRQMLDLAETKPEAVPQIIRAFLHNDAYRIEFFSQHFAFDDHNVFYHALKNADINHETISEIIEVNFRLKDEALRFTPDQIMQLICLDRSGNCAVDLLKHELDIKLIQRICGSSDWLKNIIQYYYNNKNVMAHLIIKMHLPKSVDLFVNSFDPVFNALKKSDTLATLNLVYCLIDNSGTQEVMLHYLNKHSEQFTQFIESLANEQEISLSKDKLMAKLSLITGLKSNQAWKKIAQDCQRFAKPVEEKKASTRINKTLFTGFFDNRGYTFFNHSPSTRVLEDQVSTPRKVSAVRTLRAYK